MSIIIPAHSLDDQLSICLRAIESNKAVDRTEVIVVLDGVTNDSRYFADFGITHLRVVALPSNHGPAHARNQGANNASSELLLFLDSDVEIHEDTLAQVIAFFETNDSFDALIGSYDDDPKVKTTVSRFRNLLHHYTHQQASGHATTFWGACGAIRTKIFRDAGGFDVTYEKPSIEDIELGYRLFNGGHKIALRRDVQIKQHDLNTQTNQKWAAVFVVWFLISLVIGLWIPKLLLLSALAFIAIFGVDYNFYTFLSNRFDYFHLTLAIILHWVYYLSAMAGFALGSLDFLLSNKSKPHTLKRN